jgi:hypothetical protein
MTGGGIALLIRDCMSLLGSGGLAGFNGHVVRYSEHTTRYGRVTCTRKEGRWQARAQHRRARGGKMQSAHYVRSHSPQRAL